MRFKAQRGFTITEMLVSVSIFSVFSLGVAGYLTQTFKRLGSENRASLASMELRNAMNLLSSELRMGSSVSPYLPGDNPGVVTCDAQLQVTNDTIRFLVVHDESAATRGIQAYYVGYRYDAATKRLLRGEIPSNSNVSCVVPSGDPTGSVAQVLAENVELINGNGVPGLEPAFSFSSPTITVNLGVKVDNGSGNKIEQNVTTQITGRVL